MNAIVLYEPPPKPDENTIIFLRAFIGTSSPFHKLQVGGNVIPFPMAYPREVRLFNATVSTEPTCEDSKSNRVTST